MRLRFNRPWSTPIWEQEVCRRIRVKGDSATLRRCLICEKERAVIPPKAALRRRAPFGEIGHAGRAIESHAGNRTKGCWYGVDKGAKDERPGAIESFPERVLRQPLVIRNGTKADCGGTTGEIGALRQEGGATRTIGRCPSKIIAMPTDGNHGAASTMTQLRVVAQRLGSMTHAEQTAQDLSNK
jgi:hypothetical protein